LEIDALVKNQARLDQQRRIKSKVVPIPTELMNSYIRATQARLKGKNVGYKREFLRELLKEVKIDGDKVTLTYRLPLEIGSPANAGGDPKKKFFTLCRMVEAGGIEPPSEGLRSNMTTCLADALISLFEPPAAGSLRASRFGSQPHPLRQETWPIPLSDALSIPVGEGW
jgi:hypothetical protein